MYFSNGNNYWTIATCGTTKIIMFWKKKTILIRIKNIFRTMPHTFAEIMLNVVVSVGWEFFDHRFGGFVVHFIARFYFICLVYEQNKIVFEEHGAIKKKKVFATYFGWKKSRPFVVDWITAATRRTAIGWRRRRWCFDERLWWRREYIEKESMCVCKWIRRAA